MIRTALILGAATLLPLAASISSAQPARRSAPVARDWSRTVVATPEGGFRMGNPAARAKLVEYGSLTCPHCAEFNAEAKAPLLAAVRSGKVSFEYRNYVLNGMDVTATVLARCAGPSGFFPMVDTLYAAQPQWVGKISGMPEAQKAQLRAMPEGSRLSRLADIGGLTPLAARHGVPVYQGKKCLADPSALQRLVKMAEAAEALGVNGTPTFFLNGANIGTHSWATLEPILREAAG